MRLIDDKYSKIKVKIPNINHVCVDAVNFLRKQNILIYEG